MMYPVPFRAQHLFQIDPQHAQADFHRRLMRSGVNLRVLENEWSVTLMRDDGVPLVCAMVIPMWEERALLSAYLSRALTPRQFVRVHRLAQLFVDRLPFRRVEAAVDVNFEPGHRWILMLGFQKESDRMRAYLDDRDWALYARVTPAADSSYSPASRLESVGSF